MNPTVLVTGGAGYIGSHTTVALQMAGFDTIVVDNLSNSSEEAVAQVRSLTGAEIPLVIGDLQDPKVLDKAFSIRRVDAVVHFAGLKAVGESVADPLRYYGVNLGSSLSLLRAMQRHGCTRVVFSSSATVYSPQAISPLAEDSQLGPTSPYGHTKAMIEQILTDVAAADPSMAIALLRYFNPVGAHRSGTIGEDPKGIPNNLMPFVMQVAAERRPCVEVFGDDYPTRDGTGVRDYIHVDDLARGHVAALRRIEGQPGAHVWNLGTGNGTSVLEILDAARASSGRDIPHVVTARRAGDQATVFADPTKARDELNWVAEHGIDAMVADHWRWQEANPDGYGTSG